MGTVAAGFAPWYGLLSDGTAPVFAFKKSQVCAGLCLWDGAERKGKGGGQWYLFVFVPYNRAGSHHRYGKYRGGGNRYGAWGTGSAFLDDGVQFGRHGDKTGGEHPVGKVPHAK